MSSKVQNKIDNGREYRNFVIPFEIRAAESDEMIVEGYATTFNDPYELYNMGDYIVMEQIDSKAFDECDMSDVIMQYDHTGRVFARNKNGTLGLEADDEGLKITADLGGTEIGRQLYEEIRGGYTDKMSFGFTVAKDHMSYDGNAYVRSIDAIGKLYDVSAVSLPQNNNTEIVSARKHCDGVIAELETERARAEEEAITAV